jgi:predicted nucleic acid-binding protein
VGLIDDVGRGPVAVDTATFIYFIERHPLYGPLVDPLFEAVAAGAIAAVTSAVTLLEVLVRPLRAGHTALAAEYVDLLTNSLGLTLVDLDRSELVSAAQLRALHPTLRTPDALQLAAALQGGCPVFLTNDRNLPAVPGLRVLQMGQYLRA